MSHRIEGTNNINQAKLIGFNNIVKNEQKIAAFGDGFANTANNGIIVEKQIPGLAELLPHFDFEAPKYGNFGQLNPTYEEYTTYAHLDKALDKQEALFCD